MNIYIKQKGTCGRFYKHKGIDILKNISLNLSPQENITFVGRTGAGKTTLVKLVLGLLKPSCGNITINGIDVIAFLTLKSGRYSDMLNRVFILLSVQ